MFINLYLFLFFVDSKMKKILLIVGALVVTSIFLSGCIVEEVPPTPPPDEETYLDQVQNENYIGCYFSSSTTALAQEFVPTYPTLDYLDVMVCRGGVKTENDKLVVEIHGALEETYAPLYRIEFPGNYFVGGSTLKWEQIGINREVTPGHSYYITISTIGDYTGYTLGCMNQNLYVNGEFYRTTNNMLSWVALTTNDLTFRTWGH